MISMSHLLAAISPLEITLWIALCIVFVFFSGVFSGAETGMYCINMTRLRLAAHQDNPSARRLQEILRDRAGFLFTSIFGTNLAHYLAPACLTYVFVRSFDAKAPEDAEHLAEIYTFMILTPVVFVLGDAVPKNVFQRNADNVMLRCSRILYFVHRICEFCGIIWLQRKFSELAFRGLNPRSSAGAAVQSRLDVYQMLREGAAEGTLTLTQVSILERIGRLRSLQVASVMVPFHQAVTISGEATQKAAESILRASRVSRLPVMGTEKRKVIGVVHVLDLMTASEDRTAKQMMRPPIEVTPNTRVIDALSKLQREFRRMAVVVDQRGRCLGIVTVKDLVEEIVGELKAW